MSIIKQNIKVDNVMFCEGGAITEKDGKLQFICNNLQMNVSMSGCTFIKHNPSPQNKIINLIKNTNNEVRLIDDNIIIHDTNDLVIMENGVMLKNGEYTINASITFKSSVDTNILTVLIDSDNVKLSSINGIYAKVGEVCNLVVFGLASGVDKLINIVIRSELDTDIEIIDWSILFTKI